MLRVAQQSEGAKPEPGCPHGLFPTHGATGGENSGGPHFAFLIVFGEAKTYREREKGRKSAGGE